MPAVTADTVGIGASTSFKYSTNNGGTYSTAVTKIMSFTPNKVSVGKVSVDAFDNATFNGNPVEDAIPGWVSPGTYTVKLYYLQTQYAALRALVGVQGTGSTTTKFKVIKADGSGYVFPGFISEIGEEIPLKEAMTCEITIQITGAVVPVYSTSQS